MRILVKALFGSDAAEKFGGKNEDQKDLAIHGLKERAREQRQLREARKRLHPPATIPRAYVDEVGGTMTQHVNVDENADVISGFATSAGSISAQASVVLPGGF